MAHQDETPIDIPPFAQPLAPYIKSPQEALRIRRALTAYLRSHIVFRDDDPDHPNSHANSHLSLCVPNDSVVDVKPIPPEITGLRREYLEALQANVVARKKYQDISEKIAARRLQRDDHETPTPNPDSDLQAYLKLLQGRRHYAKLQVFQHYLNELKSRHVPRAEDLEKQAASTQSITPPEHLEELKQKGESNDKIEELVHNLERAVIRAKSQLDRDKKLLEEVKARHESEGPKDDEVSPTVKAKALQRTRDELIKWVEDKLVNGSASDSAPVEKLTPEEIEDSARVLEEGKEQVRQQYTAYLEARKNLLDVASKACQPISMPSAPMPTTPSRVTDNKPTAEQTPSVPPLDALAFASENIIPLCKSQRALALQNSFLSGMLAKEKATTLRMLNRLSDESHLLPEYPIVSRQQRFKDAMTALNSRRATNSAEQTQQDEVVKLAEAWAFASDAAQENEEDHVEAQIVMGDETVQNAQKTLQEVYNMLNQDMDAMQGDKGESAKPGHSEKRAKGPWSRLNGQLDDSD
ncbi:hypothetical protein PHISCL_07395 [Aspergillus sclerotialis]|uniref:Uncharacterized protein n=1 Tax=Aspergillus sclerotialis TaxID=2070753 RepID=A0A3A2ZAX5_9EURO|nr:hypothetical protein PHISCL_07395 [Aspergillus sclerotialis]